MLAERLTAQLLAGGPARDPLAVAERLLAIQAQDPRGARLAVRARSSGLTAADVDRALTGERSLVITTLNRGTLHLIRSEDYPLLQALTTPPLATAAMTRLAKEGYPPDAAERALAVMERALAEEGPLTRIELRERLTAAGFEAGGQRVMHLIFLASIRGLIVRGPVVGRQHAFALVRDWLRDATPVRDRDVALAELARRYLAGHGPASDRDLAKWAGLPLRDVRAGLSTIASELDERPDRLVELKNRPQVAELPPPRLLGAFDPLLLGWVSREPVVGEHEAELVSGGMFRPFALVRGRAVAAWRVRNGAAPELHEPFTRVSRADVKALERELADVVRFLGPG